MSEDKERKISKKRPTTQRYPPLRIGQRVRLVWGSPLLLVVDFNEHGRIVVASEDGSEAGIARCRIVAFE